MAGEPVTTTDGLSALTNVRLAIMPSQPKPPIYLAAIGPKALRLAGAIADGVLLNAYTPVEYVKYAAEEVRKAAREAGRDPDAVDIACMLVMRQNRRAGEALARPETAHSAVAGGTPRRRDSVGEGRVRHIYP